MRRLATYGQATYGQAIQREATETDLDLGAWVSGSAQAELALPGGRDWAQDEGSDRARTKGSSICILHATRTSLSAKKKFYFVVARNMLRVMIAYVDCVECKRKLQTSINER